MIGRTGMEHIGWTASGRGKWNGTIAVDRNEMVHRNGAEQKWKTGEGWNKSGRRKRDGTKAGDRNGLERKSYTKIGR